MSGGLLKQGNAGDTGGSGSAALGGIFERDAAEGIDGDGGRLHGLTKFGEALRGATAGLGHDGKDGSNGGVAAW